MTILRRFWFEFEKSKSPTPLNIGCGVTAYDYADAVALLKDKVMSQEEVGKILNCRADVDVSTLDQKHVLPNIGSVVQRGIWFPLGY